MELRLAREQHHLLVELIRRTEPLRVPRRDLAEHPAPVLLAEHLDHQIQMPAQDANALRELRLRRQHARVQKLPRALENPRVIERPAPDAHPRAACLVEHPLRRLHRRHIAIADDRNPLHRLRHRADARQIHRAAEPLLARPPMHEDRRHPHILQHAREVRRREILVIPAETHLRRHGNLHGIHHALHQRGGFLVLHHHRRAAAHAEDLLHGTTHVDVDARHAALLEEHRRVAHLLRHRAEELHRQRPVLRVRLDELEGLRILLQQRPRIHQVRGRQVQPAQLAQREAKRQVRVTRQRREKQIGLQHQRPETNHVRRR